MAAPSSSVPSARRVATARNAAKAAASAVNEASVEIAPNAVNAASASPVSSKSRPSPKKAGQPGPAAGPVLDNAAPASGEEQPRQRRSRDRYGRDRRERGDRGDRAERAPREAEGEAVQSFEASVPEQDQQPARRSYFNAANSAAEVQAPKPWPKPQWPHSLRQLWKCSNPSRCPSSRARPSRRSHRPRGGPCRDGRRASTCCTCCTCRFCCFCRSRARCSQGR